jgi:prepilin-type N-terminal cleavage/methylation domain-containing protein
MVVKKGFSTIEMLVAMTIMVLVLSAVLLLSFGSQSLLADSAGHSEALSLADEMLDNEEALARKDFNLVTPTTAITTIGSTAYTESVAVQTQNNSLIKKITVIVSWTGEYSRAEQVLLAAYVTDFEDAFSSDTCNTELSGNWAAPSVANAIQNFAQLIGDASGTYTLTDIKARQGKLYVTANNSSSNKETFFIFTLANNTPTLLSKLDNDTKHNTGLAAVALSNTYAYVAGGLSSDQLQIIDISNPNNLTSSNIVATYKIPASDVPNAGAGNAIFYKNGYVYLGLVASGGGEFNIVDVHNPQSPAWVGGYSVGNTVNSIYVEGSYAYLATPNTKNLIVLDVSNPANPQLVGSYTPATSANGERVFALGTTVYLGRTYGTNELYVLDTSTPASISLFGLKDLGVGTNTSVNGMVLRSNIAFLLTNKQLVSYTVSNPAAISAYGTPLTLPNALSGAALACDGNMLYAAANDASVGGHGYLYVIQPGV